MYQQLGENYEVHSLGLVVADTPSHQVVDLGQSVPEIPDVKYDVVIHAAGKAHAAPKSEAEKQSFFDVNYGGTVNLLAALDRLSRAPRAFVFISTLDVYGRDRGQQISEEDDLNASEPYALSKLKAEQAVLTWKHPETVKGIVRLPLIVGKNPPGNLGRMIHAVRKGIYFNVASGKGRRSFVWIDDIAPFICKLAERGGVYNLTDGYDASFAKIYEGLCQGLNKRMNPSLPTWFAWMLAKTGDVAEKSICRPMPFNSRMVRKMTGDLTYSCAKAMSDFNWRPTRVLGRIQEMLL